MPTVLVTSRFDLTDAQWKALEPLLPRGKKPGRPATWTKRLLIDGIRWRVRTGAPAAGSAAAASSERARSTTR